jgi:hypothetical protein
MIYCRPIREADLEACLDVQPACLGDEIVGREAALEVWRQWLGSAAFQANVIESDRTLGGHRIVGCGMGVFVARAFADRELESPAPGLNARIVASAAGGESVVLDRGAIARGNAGAGLDFVNLYGTWCDDVLDSDTVVEVQALLVAALDGKTDAELSEALDLSVEAVKKRWVSLFARVEQFMPDILESMDVDSTRRGPQKRHRVVAYVRRHPEELRPYAWDGAER